MKTFQQLLEKVWTTRHCRLIVEYPNGSLRSQVLDVDPKIDWIEDSRCEGIHVTISSDIYHKAVYKCGEWDLADD
jgi:hypothetical protein